MSETKALLTQQFEKLAAAREAILAASGPLRADRDRIKNEARAKAEALNVQIKEVEKDLPQISMDLGSLARALGGRSLSQSRTAR
jgi:hypothetical protein